MNGEVIAIGTELLLGFVVNSDTAFLGRALAGLGISCYTQVTVGDNRARLAEAIRTALARADLVITCGGLGPTVDDITLETIAEVTGRRLLLNPAVLKKIRARFARLKIRMPKTNIRQAMIPQGAVVFPNDAGTAPGFLLKLQEWDNKLLAALPGPPYELMPMAERFLIPRLRRAAGETVIVSKTLKTTGLTESEVDAKVSDVLALKGNVTVGIYAHPSQVDLRITAKAPAPGAAKRRITQVESEIRRRLGNLIFGADEETLELAVGKLLRKRRLTLGIAESCTGGLLQHRITEVPGSSDYFLGGAVTYANKLKTSSLGVPVPLLQKQGAVSAQTAKAMAVGVRKLTGSKLGLAVTGIAGPTGGTKKKPVGLVYIGLSHPGGVKALRCQFSGDRSTVKFKASQAALDLVRRHVIASPAWAKQSR